VVKSTILKMIASRDLKLPPLIEFLYVEQEVVPDDTPAIEAMLKADKQCGDLFEEEKTLTAAVGAGDEWEEKINRLQHVVDELVNMGATGTLPKPRHVILHVKEVSNVQLSIFAEISLTTHCTCWENPDLRKGVKRLPTICPREVIHDPTRKSNCPTGIPTPKLTFSD
jgi:hypothetical protein